MNAQVHTHETKVTCILEVILRDLWPIKPTIHQPDCAAENAISPLPFVLAHISYFVHLQIGAAFKGERIRMGVIGSGDTKILCRIVHSGKGVEKYGRYEFDNYIEAFLFVSSKNWIIKIFKWYSQQQNKRYPKRCLLAHFELKLDFSRSEFTCTLKNITICYYGQVDSLWLK